MESGTAAAKWRAAKCTTWLEGDYEGDRSPLELESTFWFLHTDCGDAPNCEEVLAQ